MYADEEAEKVSFYVACCLWCLSTFYVGQIVTMVK